MNQKYKAVVVDDEHLAVSLLVRHIENVSEKIDIVKTFTSWQQALLDLQQYSYDILFLDISIEGRSGIDLAQLAANKGCEIIFITAHPQYALNAFGVDAAGYLLKPVDELELAMVISKCIQRISNRIIAERMTGKNNSLQEKIAIPDGGIIHYISLSSIFFLEGVNAYTKIVLDDTELLCSYTIGRVKDILPEEKFHQVHRSFIINLDRIRSYDKSGIIVMDNGAQLPVSKTNRESLLRLFAKVR